MYPVKDELRYRKKDGGMKLKAIRDYFILSLNMLSLRCLSQPLYDDLLESVNYSALKQKLILVLII